MSITLENLVPCCSACNHLKRQNAISYSPYDALRKTDAIIEFVFYPKKINEFGVFALPLENPSGHFPMKNNIDVFKINARYEINSEEIKELVIKYQSYSKNYLDYLGRIMKGFTTELSAEEIYYGSPLSEDKYHTRPLSKFRRDILEQLKAAYKLK